MSFDWNKPVSLNLGPKETDATILKDLEIPIALHGINPRTLMGARWWGKQRRKAYASNDYTCKACGVTPDKPLHAHERYKYDFDQLVATFYEIVPLCENCHSYIHWRGLPAKWLESESRVVPLRRTQIILEHGITVLLKAGLKVRPDKLQFAGIEVPDHRVEDEWPDKQYSKFLDSRWKLDIRGIGFNPKKVPWGKSVLAQLIY